MTIFQPVHPAWVGDISDFDASYERVVTLEYGLREDRPHRRTVGAAAAPRRCAICGEVEPKVSFRNEAHLIAACLGNRSLFSREDCDGCNSKSGRDLEDDLGRMFMAQRVVGRVRKRGKTAKLKRPDGLASIGGGPFDAALPIVLHPDDDSVRLVDESDNSVALSMRVPSYRPMRAIRSLLRSIWLALDPPLRERHPWLRDIAVGEVAPPRPEYFEFFFRGGTFEGVLLEVWQRRQNSKVVTSPLVMRLAFVSTVVVWCAPEPVTLQHSASLLPPMAAPRPSTAKYIQLLEPEARESARTITYTLSYERRTRAPSDGTLVKTPRQVASPTVLVEFEWSGGRVSLPATSVVKWNIDSPRPYFELKGGSMTGRLAVQLHSEKRAMFRLEFDPHLGTPRDALATHLFLSALGKGGVFRVINPQTGNPLVRIRKDPGAVDVALSNIRGFLRDLDSINRALNADLRVPAPPTTLPVREVALLAKGLKHGRVAVTPDSPFVVVMPARVARQLLSGEPKDLRASSDFPWSVLGATLDVGPSRIYLAAASPRDPSTVDRDLRDKDDDDPIGVELECTRVIHEFERWLPGNAGADLTYGDGAPEGSAGADST
jgi:hypothetical protein